MSMTSGVTTKRAAFAAKLEQLINDSDKSQIQMARDIGYDNQNIITMIKRGTTRIPLEKVAALARSLGVDPALMIRDWFAAYMSEALPDIEECVGLILTSSEKSWVRGLRKQFSPVPPLDTRLLPIIEDSLKAL